jgi:curved DNA-binding protein CbpA
MIKKIEDLNYYELLEVSPQATSQEIHKAYERVRRVYEPNSMALYSLFSPDETAAITQRIEDAYRTLVYEDNRKRYDALLKEQEGLPDLPPLPSDQTYQPRQDQPSFPAEPRYQSRQDQLSLPTEPKYQPRQDQLSLPTEPKYQSRQDQLSLPTEPTHQPRPAQPALTLPSENRFFSTSAPLISQPPLPSVVSEIVTPVSQFIAEFTGPAIKMLREQHGLAVRDIADRTKVGARYLECIEEELYDKLPARAYTRGFLMLYAKSLGCDPERMSNDYLKRYDAAMASKSK